MKVVVPGGRTGTVVVCLQVERVKRVVFGQLGRWRAIVDIAATAALLCLLVVVVVPCQGESNVTFTITRTKTACNPGCLLRSRL